MADTDKMDRTWLCSVLFMDIARYSSQSVELQMKSKKRFNGYLAEAIRDVPEGDRVILDTGDGAAVCFLGAPEAAMFAALQLCLSFGIDDRENQPGLRVRLGINLGPVKLIRDINGALNAIGDGLNAAQRIMSFAPENEILVSQSYFEVVSRLSDDYRPLFQLKGVETDKHVREHTVYYLVPPMMNKDGRTVGAAPKLVIGNRERASIGRWIPWLITGVAVAAAGAVTAWHFHASSAPAAPPMNDSRKIQAESIAPNPEPWASTSAPGPDDKPLTIKTAVAATSAQSPPAGNSSAQSASEPPHPARPTAPDPKPVEVSTPPVTPTAPETTPPLSSDAQAAYNDGMRLIDESKPAEAAHRFDDALRASPDYVDAYVGRAEARRMLLQYDLSLADCNKVIQLKSNDPRGYHCRGFARQLSGQSDAAVSDFTDAIRLNPRFIIAYEHRGNAYDFLQQYDRAVQDYSEAIRLAPRNGLFYWRRAVAYNNMKQYDKAIRDCTEAIRLQPNNANAYRVRALAEEALGDTAGAAADRSHLKESPRRKLR